MGTPEKGGEQYVAGKRKEGVGDVKEPTSLLEQS